MNYKLIDKSSYDDALVLLENEGDWPHRSAYTGFENDGKDGPVRSVYKYMLDRNRCNRNDY